MLSIHVPSNAGEMALSAKIAFGPVGTGANMTTTIHVEQLTRNYNGHRGVEALNFEVGEGEVFGFLGPNGAGKTTTIRLLMGLLRPTSGAGKILGHDCWLERAKVKEFVGYLPGDIRLYERLTGRETLEFFASFRESSDWSRVMALADRLDLELDRPVRQLSKGNRQKVAIIQALMHDAPILILDEPTAGLDPLKQHEFLEILRDERERGRTVFLSSHDLAEVERVADRVAIIRRGRLVAVESIETLKSLRQRPMTVRLGEAVDLRHLGELDGIEVTSVRDGGMLVELRVAGPLPPLLAQLAQLPVEDLIYGPPDLESVFLRYYAEEEAMLAEHERAAQ